MGYISGENDSSMPLALSIGEDFSPLILRRKSVVVGFAGP